MQVEIGVKVEYLGVVFWVLILLLNTNVHRCFSILKMILPVQISFNGFGSLEDLLVHLLFEHDRKPIGLLACKPFFFRRNYFLVVVERLFHKVDWRAGLLCGRLTYRRAPYEVHDRRWFVLARNRLFFICLY